MNFFEEFQCELCGGTGRSYPTLGDPDGVECECVKNISKLPKKRYITTAAIWYKKLPTMKYLPVNITYGHVICGYRHAHIINIINEFLKLRAVTTEIGEYEQGFMTNYNEFVDRDEAAKIAVAAKQCNPDKTYLYSEDIY